MKFLKGLFKREKKKEKDIKPEDIKPEDIKPLIDEFIKGGIPNEIKSEKVIKNIEFILNTLFESKIKNPNPMNVMGLVLKIRKRIGMSKETMADIKKLLELFLKFMEKKGLITEEVKKGLIEAPLSPVTIRRDAPKIGRNSPCFCGSGKKYKLCCGR